MPAVLRFSILTVLQAAAWLLAPAALQAAEDVGAAPASHIRDAARLFDNAGENSLLAHALTAARQDLGVYIYVASFSYLEGETMHSISDKLLSRWLSDKPGIVLAYNRGNSQPAISASPEMWRRYPADELALLLFDSAKVLGNSLTPPERRIQDTVHLLVERIGKMEQGRQSRHQHFGGLEFKLALSLALIVSAVAAAGWFAARKSMESIRAQGGPYYFPDVDVGTRLGAPFGGGVVGQASPSRQS